VCHEQSLQSIPSESGWFKLGQLRAFVMIHGAKASKDSKMEYESTQESQYLI
jgi:hypothetical protein